MTTTKHKLNKIMNEIDSYKDRNLQDNINDRLNKTLELYLEELDNSYSRLRGKDAHFVAKRLSK